MLLTYEKGECIVNNIEIRKVICNPYYDYDCSLYPTCDIIEMEAYINNELIDIEDESLISDNLWNKIIDKICYYIPEENFNPYFNKKKETSILKKDFSFIYKTLFNIKN